MSSEKILVMLDEPRYLSYNLWTILTLNVKGILKEESSYYTTQDIKMIVWEGLTPSMDFDDLSEIIDQLTFEELAQLTEAVSQAMLLLSERLEKGLYS
ncbi:hypothetical protein SAMN05444392_102317 [Seinonella peptonophila]|uniref:Uncharacterized protein n=1 Tax=Seinonella peptonophila TaxID=112248 RepID=A0A1M4VE80_9BACL|nr:hypothetical protein [Seinonella peptonophila]SHE67237.1 hypothetical protein SAMN05444392_102317 [Seinonella peptonophila]